MVESLQPIAKKSRIDIPKSDQVDSHVREFLSQVLLRSKTPTGKKKKIDAFTQTDSEELGVLDEEIELWKKSLCDPLDSPPQEFGYEIGHEDPIVSADKVKTIMSKWIKQYETWFKNNFGVDVISVDVNDASSDITLKSSQQLSLDPNVYSENMTNVVNFPEMNPSVNGESFENLPQEVSFPGCNEIINSSIFSDPFVRLIRMHNPSQTPQTNGVPLDHQNLLLPSANLIFNNFQMPVHNNPQLDFSSLERLLYSLQNAQTIPNTQCKAEMEEAQISAMLAAALMVSNEKSSSNNKSDLQWGPRLKYCTYGRLENDRKSFSLFKKMQDPLNAAIEASMKFTTNSDDSSADSKEANPNKIWMPPAPPTLILLKKQSLICTLQELIKVRLVDLRQREKNLLDKCDNGLMIPLLSLDWVEELDKICREHAYLEPVYIFRRVRNLPVNEINFYLSYRPSSCSHATILNPEQMKREIIFFLQLCSHQVDKGQIETCHPTVYVPTTDSFDATKDMVLCDLMIGSIFIGQTLADDRRQAKMCAAKMAFKKLEESNFLVGSVRSWAKVDYLSVCLSPLVDLVPSLPSFLYDPTQKIPEDAFDVDLKVDPATKVPETMIAVSNPKSIDEFWLYLADFEIEDYFEKMSLERLVAQSCMFSQMRITFEMDVDTNYSYFICYTLVDNCYRVACGVGTNAASARAQSLANFVHRVRKSQPIVSLRKSLETDEEFKLSRKYPLSQLKNKSVLWGLTSKRLIENLMWGNTDEYENPLLITELPQVCEIFDNYSNENSLEKLILFIQSYAASAVVIPLALTCEVFEESLWPSIQNEAHAWLLLTSIESDPILLSKLNTDGDKMLIICKQKPLPRLKATLLLKGECNDFVLSSKGALNEQTTKRIIEFEPFLPQSVAVVEQEATPPQETVTKTDPDSVVQREEEKDRNEDCFISMTELNSKNNPCEILDDLPRQLIPGIDF